jgi:hypothetical protein
LLDAFLAVHGIQGPPFAIATGLIYSYAAHVKTGQGEEWRGFAVAGATTVAMIPYTWIFMRSINNKLWAAVRGEKETCNMPEARDMLNTWSRLNMVRALAGWKACLFEAEKAVETDLLVRLNATPT